MDKRWNFVIFQTDDQGRWAVPWRMPELHMPELDRLKNDGLELDQMYCASPVCSPSRASTLTGRLPSAHGIHDWLVGDRNREAFEDDYLAGQPSTAEVLAKAGYQCGMSGKWHVGTSKYPASGFTHWYAHRYGGGPYFDAPVWRDQKPVNEERYLTYAITEEAIAFLEDFDKKKPFYLQVNYTAPHTPWIDNHLLKHLKKYEECDFPSVPRQSPHPWVEPRKEAFAQAFADPRPHLAGYCASLAAVDEGIGEIRAWLAEHGLADNTVVAFFSDNGFSCGHHGIWGKGNGTWPINFWDNSVRVPCVVYLPEGAQGVSEELLSSASWHATICELAGVDLPQDRWGIAESFADVLEGRRCHRNEFVVVVSEYGGARMVTDGRMVYVTRFDGPDELYDNQADPHQVNNLVDDPAYGDELRRLQGGLEEWFARLERPGYGAFERPVTGYGQVHPLSRGLSDQQTYAQSQSLDS